MITLHLHKLKFTSYHGVYPEERINGNEFEVNLEVTYDEMGAEITSIEQTISYEELFYIVKARMDIPTPLLETIAIDIGNTIHNKYSFAKSIKINILKHHPPIEELNGVVGISWHKEY